jgi:hypothetical protein
MSMAKRHQHAAASRCSRFEASNAGPDNAASVAPRRRLLTTMPSMPSGVAAVFPVAGSSWTIRTWPAGVALSSLSSSACRTLRASSVPTAAMRATASTRASESSPARGVQQRGVDGGVGECREAEDQCGKKAAEREHHELPD